jgi:putative ABC transport system substrate-binding protein
MRRREFIALLGGMSAASPLAVLAQQGSMPVVGFLSLRTAAETKELLAAFQQGLSETGFVEGRNAAIESRWADGHYERLAPLAADLVSRNVAVIATSGGSATATAAKAATSRIPIVFSGGSDPVAAGLVASFSRPGGNVTGVLNIAAELTAKRFEILLELAPAIAKIGVLRNPGNSESKVQLQEIEKAARLVGKHVTIATARTELEIEAAVAGFPKQQIGALLVANDPFFASKRERLVALVAQHHLPAIYPQREYAEAGGLISYGTNFPDVYRQVGVYTGRILKGEKPADLPVMRPSRFELVINRKTAGTHGIELPNKLLALADDVLD